MASNKTWAAIAVVVIVVIAAAAAVVLTSGNNEEEDPANDMAVTYVGNGGETADGEDSVTDESGTAIENVFTRDGYTFTGWNIYLDGSGDSYSPGDAVIEGMTLYAQWAQQSAVLNMTSIVDDDNIASSFGCQIGDSSSTQVLYLNQQNNFAISSTEENIIWLSPDTVTVDEENNNFTFKYNDTYYTLTLELSGDVGEQHADGVAGSGQYRFTATGDVELSISIVRIDTTE